jgi:acyl carrier protein
MTVRAQLRKFIADNFYVSEPGELDDETPLVTSGIVDSTGMLEVIAFLEGDLGIRVGDDETTPDNLGSIARIAAFVERKRAGAARLLVVSGA